MTTLGIPQPALITSPATSPGWIVERTDRVAVIARSSTANIPGPDSWQERLVDALTRFRASGVTVVGAKRVHADGTIFSMGEFVVHPKGFHHLGRGLSGHAFRFPEEVDVIAGGVMAVDEVAFDAVDGEDALRGELGAIELCLRLRARGGRCIAVPEVVVVDARSPRPRDEESKAFEKRWGFDWRAADLDRLRACDSGSAIRGLLWNVRLHGLALPFEKYEQRPAMHWKNYAETPVYRQRADHLAKLAAQHFGDGDVLDLGCGDGLFSHLLAMAGMNVTGLDVETAAIDQARSKCASQIYPERSPRFEHSTGGPLPFADGSFNGVVMFDVIEHLPNPVALLREFQRVLPPGGKCIISTPSWQYGGSSDPVYHLCEYTMEELTRQIQAATDMTIAATGTIGGVYRDLVVVAQRPGE